MRSLFLAGLAIATASAAVGQTAPTQLMAGVWPDRIIFFDQTTEAFTEGLRLRHGAVTASAFTPDRRKAFLVTDRMESVEVVDVVRREVVDELKLSTGEHRIRISRVFPNADGTKAYLVVNVMRLEIDRFIQERDYDVVVYDLERDEVVERFMLPTEITGGNRPNIFVSEDGSELYVMGADIHVIDAETKEVKATLELSEPLLSGYGGLRGVNLHETAEPGVFYGIYRTTDPVLEKELFGLSKIDVPRRRVESFELGPRLRVGGVLDFSPDGTRAYAGLRDMVVVDMEKKKVLLHKEGFERGRANNSLIVSHDGSKVYVSGVGDTVWIYDAETLELLKSVFAGGDFMLPPVEVPAPATASSQ